MSLSVKEIGGKSVIIVDCANMDTSRGEEIKKTLEQASALVATKPEKSVYIITHVANLKFNSDVAEAFKKYAAANTAYVKESVLVGLSGIANIIFTAIKTLTKREYRLVNTMDEAFSYMASVK